MIVTSVRFFGTPRDNFVAYASIVLDDCLAINGVKLVRSKKNSDDIMIFMPSRQRDNGDYTDVAHPITTDFRQYLNDYIVNAWNEQQANPRPPARPQP